MVVPDLEGLPSILVKFVEVCIFAVDVATGLVLMFLMMGAAYCSGSLLLRLLSKLLWRLQSSIKILLK